MTRRNQLDHEFVEYIPDRLSEGILYISIPFATALHLCCCGCGTEVVTPISSTDWELTFNGESISLSPSIGSWSLDCQSHYFISNNRVHWAPKWSPARINASRLIDRMEMAKYFQEREHTYDVPATTGGHLSLLRRLPMRVRRLVQNLLRT